MRQSARFDDSAYTRERRLSAVDWLFKTMIEKWPSEFENTQSRHIATTNRLTIAEVKAMKAKYRNELSFGGDK